MLGSLFPHSFCENIFAYNKKPSQVYTTLETSLYKLPNITSDCIKDSSNKIIYLKTGTTLSIVQDYTDTNDMFYKINIFGIIPEADETDTAFVLIAHTADISSKSPQKKLDYNAKVKNDNSIIYQKSGDNYIETSTVLNSGTNVRILDNGYKNKSEYTYISFYSNDNTIVSYYIKTTNLHADGINYTIIAACFTLFACVSIILALLGVKKKKSKHIKYNIKNQ